MTARHRVEHLDVDMECGVPGAAVPDEDALARFVRTVLLPAVADVLDALDEPGTVLTVPEIALDLGEIELAAVHEEAPLRLRTLLAEALADAKRAAGGARGAVHVGTARVGAEDDGLAQLAGFLAGGRLPWHADLRRRDLHADLLAQALARPRAPLLRMLDAVLRRPAALRRLVEQYPAAQVRSLLTVADGVPAPSWRQALAAALEPGAVRLPASAAEGSGLMATARLVAPSLDCLATDGRSVAAADQRATSPSAPAAAGSLMGAASVDTVPRLAHGAGVADVTRLYPAGVAPEFDGRGATSAAAATPVLGALAAFLRSGRIDAGAVRPVDAAVPAHVACLDAALAMPSAALAAVLRAALGHPVSARRLVEQFPSRQQIGIVRALAPGHAAALLTLFAALQDARPVDVSHGVGRVAAWRIVLGLALDAPASGTDAASVDAAVKGRMRGRARDRVADAAAPRPEGSGAHGPVREPVEAERVAAGRAAAAPSMTPAVGAMDAGPDADAAASPVADAALPALGGIVQAFGSHVAIAGTAPAVSDSHAAERADGVAASPSGSARAGNPTAAMDASHPDSGAPRVADAAPAAVERERRGRVRAAEAAAYRSLPDDAAAGTDPHPPRFGNADGARPGTDRARAGAEADGGSAPVGAIRADGERAGGTAPHADVTAGQNEAVASAAVGAADDTARAAGPSAHARDCVTVSGESTSPPVAPPATAGAPRAVQAADPAGSHPPVSTRTAGTGADFGGQDDTTPAAADATRAELRRSEELTTRPGDSTAADPMATDAAGATPARVQSGAFAGTDAPLSTGQRPAAAEPAREHAAMLPDAAPPAIATEPRTASDIGTGLAVHRPSVPAVPAATASHAASAHAGAAAPGQAPQATKDDDREREADAATPPAALLARLLEDGDTRGRAALRSALVRLLGMPDGARRLATVIPDRLRAPLVRLLVPAPADALLAVLGESEARIAAQRYPAAHARQLRTLCWEAVLAVCASAPAGAPETLRGRLASVLAQAAQGPRRTTPPAAAERLLAFLRMGRLAGPATGADAPGALLAMVLASPYRGSDWWPGLAQVLAEPQALRRLVTQFAGRELAAIVRCAVPAHADAWLAVADALDPANDPAAWSVLAAAAVRSAAGLDDIPDTADLRARIEEAVGIASADGPPADAAWLQSIRRGDVKPPAPGDLDAMLARDAHAVVATLAAQDDRGAGPQRLHGLVAACGEAGRAALLDAAAAGEASVLSHVPAVLQACARGHAGFPLAAAWCDVLDAALTAPAGQRAAHVRARVPGAPVRRLRPVPRVVPTSVPAWRAPWPERAAGRVLRGLLAEAGRARAGAAPSASAPPPAGMPAPMSVRMPMLEAMSRQAPAWQRAAARLVDECAALAALLAEPASGPVAGTAGTHGDTARPPAQSTLPSGAGSAFADAARPTDAASALPPSATGDRDSVAMPSSARDNPAVRAWPLPAADGAPPSSAGNDAAATAPSASDAAGWRRHIRRLLDASDPVVAARRRTMFDAIDAAAADHPDPCAFLQRVAQTLEAGEPLDLEATADAAQAADGHARDPAAAARAAVAHMLSTPDDAPAPAAWTALLTDRPEAVRAAMRALAGRAAWRAALADALPERMLVDLMEAADPALATALRDLQRHGTAFASVFGAAWPRRLWRGALAVFGNGGVPPVDSALLCERIVRAAAGVDPAAQAAAHAAWRAVRTPTPPAAAAERRIQSASVPAGAATPRNGPEPQPATARADARAIPWPGMGTPEEDIGIQPGERIALDNAGIVLAAPYLPRLFVVLDLVRDGAFVDAAAAERAVHLLQYAASGETDAPEYRLVFNKLLCGLAPEAPVPAAVDLTQDERDTVESLLQALIASWSAIGRTSVAGLRQTFLMRAGELEARSDDWQLKVAAGPFDMLMDRLPWSFSIVKFAWMPLPVHVTWRE